MKLSENQKTVIQLINDDRFTPELCEKFWKANASEICKRQADWSFYVMTIKEVNAFMRAVSGIVGILEERAMRRTNEPH